MNDLLQLTSVNPGGIHWMVSIILLNGNWTLTVSDLAPIWNEVPVVTTIAHTTNTWTWSLTP